MTDTQDVSKEEQVGFHKGALSTLAKERQELLKMVNVVEQLMQMHVKALQDLGVDLQKLADAGASAQVPAAGESKPIEDLINKTG